MIFNTGSIDSERIIFLVATVIGLILILFISEPPLGTVAVAWHKSLDKKNIRTGCVYYLGFNGRHFLVNLNDDNMSGDLSSKTLRFFPFYKKRSEFISDNFKKDGIDYFIKKGIDSKYCHKVQYVEANFLFVKRDYIYDTPSQ